MGWRTGKAIIEEIGSWDDGDVDKLIECYSLSRILRGCIFLAAEDDYESVFRSIVPSSHALDIIRKEAFLLEASPLAIKVACFISFYHHDLMFDLVSCDVSEIRVGLEHALHHRALVAPSRFGRVLYDQYASQFPDTRQDSLSPEETVKLLGSIPQGVAQVGRTLIGPLGILYSEAARLAAPSVFVPLWHCSDVGCGHLHNVILNDKNAYLRDVIRRLDDVASLYMGSPAHWATALSSVESEDYSLEYGDLFAFVHEGISNNEARLLLIDLLTGSANKSPLWDIIREKRLAKTGSSNPSTLVEKLDRGVVNQLILTMPDQEIVASIDSLVWNRAIKVPPTEVRFARHAQPSPDSINSRCALSSLGLRSESGNPISTTALAIWKAYDEAERLADLSWRAIRAAGPATAGTVIDYLNSHDPETAVRELILSTREVAEDIAESVWIRGVEQDRSDEAVSRMLWKLGFDTPRASGEYSAIIRQLDRFKEVLLRCEEPLNGVDREHIRSAGVNLFVELENLLENLISFNVWLLSADHFISKFIYEPNVAIASVGRNLLPQGPVGWNDDGGNTLGTLMTYLSSAVEWMKSLSVSAGDAEKRPLDEYPHFADVESEIFPFHYRIFWQNCDQSELEKFAKTFEETGSLFLRADPAGIRNGLDHYRTVDNFPKLDAMLACEARLRQAIDTANAKRLIPKRWWLRSRTVNSFGQVWEVFQDDERRKVELRYPSALTGIGEGYFGDANVIPNGNLLGQANATVLMKVVEDSEYQQMWFAYPARPKMEGSVDEPVIIEQA